ncbi:aspartate aminotransferase family protein [Leucobacter salsicius]|uniref:aspartate aminotransferase family protein n=1 Tax=Leucobacter salsicius TaxID=664638 RepID=UPI0003459B60|nr:aminotransferase class III-fold pyridoxal phosphate-dependent enzyme [Leucobacter salsicius]
MSTETPSFQQWEEARKVIPRGASSGHRLGFEQVFVKAKGAYMWDREGNQYLDFLNAWGPIVLGHSDSRVNDAVYKSVNTCDLTGVGPQLGEVELGEKITRLMPSAEKVAFCTSGTDATMHASHIARAVTGRMKVLKFHGSYHGWSDHVAVGGSRAGLTKESPLNTVNSAGLHPAVTGDVIVVEWNDAEGLRAAFNAHGAELAAAFAEGYVHSYGCVAAAPGFLELLRDLCTQHGTIFVLDEVKTGFRAALGGIQEVTGVTPDLTAFGKAVANGFSLAGLAGRDEFMDHLGAYAQNEVTIDGTYNANPYAMAAGNATLDIMESENTIGRLYELGERLREGYARAIVDTGVEAVVTGLGSEWAVYFRAEAPRNFRDTLDVNTDRYAAYQQSLMKQRVLETTAATGDRRLNASTTNDDIDAAIDAVRGAFAAAASI